MRTASAVCCGEEPRAQRLNREVNGGGQVPNAGDWALIVFNKDSAGWRIGDYTGYLGYLYPALIGRHMTVLGYPANLDAGTQMHRVESMANFGALLSATCGAYSRAC